jgi:RimJ/RimL family protein N-acetyltransferase
MRSLPPIVLRPFAREDFMRLRSWVVSQAALAEWSGAFFRYPLNDDQLERYLESGARPLTRVIWTAEAREDGPVGHIEISHIWPHLSSRLSRVLIAPFFRGRGLGSAMVAEALAYSFRVHMVDRIDLGVSATNAGAIRCYERLGFKHVGTWPGGVVVGSISIDVCWMTAARPKNGRQLQLDHEVI